MSELRVPSSEFRVTFARLKDPVAVTVLGRVIGWWTPVPRPVQDEGSGPLSPARTEASALAVDVSASSGPPAGKAGPKGPGAPADGSTAPMTQRERDKILQRVAKG